MMNNIKIKTLIIYALSILAAMMLVIGGLGIYSIKHTATILQNTSLKDVKIGATVEKIRFKMEVNRSQILQLLQHNPGMEWAKLHDHPLAVHFKIMADTTNEINQLWAQYTAAITSPEERKLADAWFAKSGSLGVNAIGEASAAVQQGKWDDGETVLIRTINPSYRVSDDDLRALTEFLTKRAQTHSDLVNTDIARTGYQMLSVLIVATLLGIATGIVLVRNITLPLQQAISIAQRVAQGDLTAQIEVRSTNEFGQLIKALQDMNASLAHIVRDVRAATYTIDGASDQIASGNLDLSNRTEQQASSLEETSASMEELTSTVRQNGDNAMQANQLALSAAEVARKGGTVVSQVVSTMGSINESSRKIVDIISVIDGIAFQTNILALNAAVEAARAGEQGRGFAVVATEVRNLAQRSAGAAKEIKTLIDNSVEKIDHGNKLVDQAGLTMEEIVTSVQRVTDIMGEITMASKEQSAGINHINNAISEMDGATQQNAALVEQAAASASMLDDQAKNLVHLVSVFKLSGAAATASAPASSTPHNISASRPPKPKLTSVSSKNQRLSIGA